MSSRAAASSSLRLSPRRTSRSGSTTRPLSQTQPDLSSRPSPVPRRSRLSRSDRSDCSTSSASDCEGRMRLCINIDHVATLREARGGVEPDPVTAAQICELAGADGIVCHLREDRRHINDRDVRLLRDTVKTKLDLEMAATDEIVRIAIDTLPELATLVPERRQELTTEGGLDVKGNRHRLHDVVQRLQEQEIEVSLFIDPVPAQV